MIEPAFHSVATQVFIDDALSVLRALPDESVQMCVTSPPYFGLRKYSDSPHEIGIEETPAAFVAALVAVFREVRRVLRNDGTLWLNLGDSYANDCFGTGSNGAACKQHSNNGTNHNLSEAERYRGIPQGMKKKDLMMIPARVAIALCDDGWYLRSEITWCKKAPMPESVTDRPTSATEKIYLLSKSAKYFYDADAVREPLAMNRWSKSNTNGAKGNGYKLKAGSPGQTPHSFQRKGHSGYFDSDGNPLFNEAGRNQWNYWLLAPESCKEAHFATFPTEIPRRAILAGSRIGDTILEPFLGSGTTAMVAQQLGRRCIGIELNPDYLPIIRRRICAEQIPMDIFEKELAND